MKMSLNNRMTEHRVDLKIPETYIYDIGSMKHIVAKRDPRQIAEGIEERGRLLKNLSQLLQPALNQLVDNWTSDPNTVNISGIVGIYMGIKELQPQEITVDSIIKDSSW